MFRARMLLVALILTAGMSGCSRPKADTVLIVSAAGVSVHGKTEMVQDGDRFRPKVWLPGNVVIFRVNEDIAGQKGEAGGIYRINKDNNLERIGTADLRRNDGQLAAQFGIKAATAGK